MKIILDTDTGIDDAIAILQMIAAKKKGQVEVLAITAVNGNCKQEDAIRNICRTLDTVNCHDVPVYSGAKEPLVVKEHKVAGYHGTDGFNDVKFDQMPDFGRVSKEENAWTAINRLTKQYPQEITLIAIGPLTNIATAIKLDPELPTRLKEIFIMGGNVEGIGNVTTSAEYNFFIDPEAADIVLRQTRCPTYISSWELSFKYTFVDVSWRKSVLGKLDKPAANLINQLEEPWFRDWAWGPNWILCDQLAMTPALDRSSILKTSKGRARVETAGVFTRGQMVLDQRARPTMPENVIIIEKLDTDKIKEQMMEAFNQ